MSGQAGKDQLLKMGDGQPTEAFSTVAGSRTNSIQLGETAISLNSKDDAHRMSEALRGGRKTMTTSLSGVFKDATGQAAIVGNFMATDGTIKNWQLLVPGFGTFEGPFIITSLAYGGDDEDAVTFDATLESAGEITFTAV